MGRFVGGRAARVAQGIALVACAAGILALVRYAGDRGAPSPLALEVPARQAENSPGTPEVPSPFALPETGERPTAAARGAHSPDRVAPRTSVPSAPRPVAPIRGMVVDTTSGAGIGGCRVYLRYAVAAPNRVSEKMLTDGLGRFESRAAYPEDAYVLEARLPGCLMFSGPEASAGSASRTSTQASASLEWTLPHGTRAEHEHDPAAAHATEVVIEIDLGPSFLLDVRLPDDYHPCLFRCTLQTLERDPQILGRANGLQGEPPYPLCFPPIEAWTPTSAALLVVETSDGEWRGAALVSTATGPPSFVHLELTRRARVAGRVIDAAGAPVAGVRIDYEPDGGAEPRDFLGHGLSNGSGRFEIGFLPAGPGTLRFEAEGSEPLEHRMRLVAGGTSAVEVRLPSRLVGWVRGTLLVRSGELVHPPRLELRAIDGGGPELPRAVFRTLDATRWTFVFEGLALGEYELAVEPVDGYAWEPVRMRVSAPAEGLEIVRLEEQLAMLVLDVVDARDGSPLPGAHGLVEDGTRVMSSSSDGEGSVLIDGLAPSARVLHVDAPGHRPRRLDPWSFRRNGRFLVGTVELEEGPGGLARVVDARTGRAIGGASIEAGGRVLGTTGAAGVAVLDGDARRERLVPSLPGWSDAGPALGAAAGAPVLRLRPAE